MFWGTEPVAESVRAGTGRGRLASVIASFFLWKKQGFLNRIPKTDEIPPLPCICHMAMILIFGYRRRQIPLQNP